MKITFEYYRDDPQPKIIIDGKIYDSKIVNRYLVNTDIIGYQQKVIEYELTEIGEVERDTI